MIKSTKSPRDQVKTFVISYCCADCASIHIAVTSSVVPQPIDKYRFGTCGICKQRKQITSAQALFGYKFSN